MSALERHATVIAFLLVLFASARIIATYTVFNHTSDEPNHIACGMEWIQNGTYTFETQHPPLARVAVALGPYLIGARVRSKPAPDSLDVPIEGLQILSRDHRYDLTLALARLGVLPFFWLACATVYWWARRYHGPRVALAALFFFTFTPPVLAHAGLATTDMPLTACLGASIVAAFVWIEKPTLVHAALLGLFSGLAVISKLSSLPFFPACLGFALLFYIAYERPSLDSVLAGAKRAIPSLGVSFLVAATVIWAGFRFSFGKFSPTSFRIPAPELVTGIQAVMNHNQIGHLTYFFGQYSLSGFWYYFPVVLAIKTPLALVFLFLLGLFLSLRKGERSAHVWEPLGLITGILAVGFYSRINIGVRHILPIYMGISLLAAIGATRLPKLFKGRWPGVVLAGLVLWLAGSSLLAHPDYLPYFNELAGNQPEKILVDSDLDWGQDAKRLAKRLRELGATQVAFYPPVMIDLADLGFPPVIPEKPFQPAPGWNAVSLTDWKLTRMGVLGLVPKPTIHIVDNAPGRPVWPDLYPRGEPVGKSILLWNMAADPSAATSMSR